jgi:hypothetical protein
MEICSSQPPGEGKIADGSSSSSTTPSEGCEEAVEACRASSVRFMSWSAGMVRPVKRRGCQCLAV